MSGERPPIRVFFSYSHADDRHRIRLEKALKLLERQGLIDTWTDRKLLPGDRWEEGIAEELERADLILFLVSDDFIASDFIWGREMKRALEREERGEARVVPVIVRPCDWHPAPFFLDEEALQSGLLVSRTEGEVELWHLSFQEYLAALELATGADYWEIVSEDGRLHDDRWSEVVLLLAGCLRRLGGLRAARRLIERVLATGADRVRQARAVGLVGRILVDVKPYGSDPSVGTGYSAALTETLAIFEPPGQGEEALDEVVRVEVGEALGQAGDPRLASPDENWITIPGGTFGMGAQKTDPEAPGYDPEAFEDEAPVRRVTVSPFLLGRFPVAVQELRRFVEAGDEGYLDPRCWHPEGWAWRERNEHTGPGSWSEQLRHPNRPVRGVSWYEADAYCRWVGGRLPTEAEWELAARGEEARRYPWGREEPDPLRASFAMNVGRPTPVGVYPLGASPEGVRDLAGNVWEWCADWFGDCPPDDQTDPTGPPSGASRVLRGGSFGNFPRFLRAADRGGDRSEFRRGFVGFRVLCSSSGGL